MSDGRIYASWKPDAEVNDKIRRDENIQSNWSYRQYLTQNANKIMKINSQEYCHELNLPYHLNSGKTPSTNVPFLYRSSFDTSKPGFGYNNSDLKSPYLTREQLQSRIVSPSIPTTQFTN